MKRQIKFVFGLFLFLTSFITVRCISCLKQNINLIFGTLLFIFIITKGCILYQEETGVLDLETSTSPDGKYELIIRLIPSLSDIRLFAMPGDGGRSFNHVRAVLIEKATGKVICRTKYNPRIIYCVVSINWDMENDKVRFAIPEGCIKISTGTEY